MMPRKQGSAAFPLIAVAIDKDKNSQNALKWALDNIISKGQTVNLIHVNTKAGSGSQESGANDLKEVFFPFRIFCKRKDVQCNDIVLEETDVARAIIEFVSQSAIDKLVIGSSTKGFIRFKVTDLAATVLKGAPDFCTVYVISKSKISNIRKAVRDAPIGSPLRAQIQNQASLKNEQVDQQVLNGIRGDAARESRYLNFESKGAIRSPFSNRLATLYSENRMNAKMTPESDISFVGSNKQAMEQEFFQRLSVLSDNFDQSPEMLQSPRSSISVGACSTLSHTNSASTFKMEDVKAEMTRLRLELKHTMDLYGKACREALTAKQKAIELQQLKEEEAQKLEQARVAEESAWAMVEKERARCKAALEAAEASKRMAEVEAQMRINAEIKALQEAEDMKAMCSFKQVYMKAMCSFKQVDVRYRSYTIEEIEAATDNFSERRKIGEGGYGPVYKCHLDHTPVAIKALRPDATHGRAQFQQEVEILSCIRHPNMVLLLGACPEFGCLIYEYMANGSLEDRLLQRGNTRPIPWQHRFRIAAEIGTALLFLHQTKPEPLVHRDLKPANILLDRNYVSKISDVGLARLVPPSVADSVTQYRMTSAAGTFCYIDPEYQQTGMLGTKSDIYSFGVLLLQLITARPPMGLTHHIECGIEEGNLKDLLDPTVQDWPVDETLSLAQLALKCVELRRKDRPDLATVVLPELNRLRAFGEDNIRCCSAGCPPCFSPRNNQSPTQDEVTTQTESSQGAS